MRLILWRKGCVYWAGMRPSRVTSDSRTMARARNPSERSRRLTQLTAVTTPRRANAIASAFCMNLRAEFTINSRRAQEQVAANLRGKEPGVDRFCDEAGTAGREYVIARCHGSQRDNRNGRGGRVG